MQRVCRATAIAVLASLLGFRGGLVAADRPYEVVPGLRFGPITEQTARPKLESLFPRASIRDVDVEIGEGICTPGTRVLEGSDAMAEIAWQDAARTRVAFVRTGGSRWVTPRGVRAGMTLRALERLHGSPVVFSGFGWDYGGRMEWSEAKGTLALELGIDPRQPQAMARASAIPSIQGDRPVRSDLEAIRSLPIVVERLTLEWGRHHAERDCEAVARQDGPSFAGASSAHRIGFSTVSMRPPQANRSEAVVGTMLWRVFGRYIPGRMPRSVSGRS